MVKILTAEEVPICVEAGKAFFDEGKMPGGFKPEFFTRTWETMIGCELGVIFGLFAGEQFQGGLGAIITTDPNNGDKMAVESFWFIMPQFRGRGILLLNAFEHWAFEQGCVRVAMIHLLNLQPERLQKLYVSRGYEAVEINYIKELK